MVRGDLQKKELVRNTWSSTDSMRTLKYFFADADKHKAIVHQLDFIEELLQGKVKNRLFLKLESRYADYFPEYSNYFGISLRLLKYMYVMTNYGKLFSDELIEWLLGSDSIQSQCQISIYYKYAAYGTNIVILSYVNDCVYWYTSEAIGKWSVDTLGNRFHVNFLGYSHWYMSIRISNMKDHYISVDQAIYATSVIAKYLDTDTVKAIAKFYKTTLLSDMIFTKYDASTSDEQVEKLTRKFNIHYRDCIGLLIYFIYTRVYLSFAVHKLAKFSSSTGKVHSEDLVHLLRYIRDNKTLGSKYSADMNDAPVSNLLRQASIKNENQLVNFSDFS